MSKEVLLKVRIDDKGNLVITKLRKNLNGVEKDSKKAASGIKSILNSLLLYRGISLFTGAVRNATNDVLEFNKIFLQTQNIAKVTTQQIDGLKDAVIDLSNNVEFTTVELARGSLLLAKMGIHSVTEQISVLPKIANFATSAIMNFNQALESSATISRAFYGQDMSQFEKTVDVMQGAISSTMMNAEDYMNAMKFIAPIAKTVGISLAETSSLVGKLADVGIKGSIAGTTFKNTFLNLLKPAEAVNRELQTMNTESMSVADILAELSKRGLNAIDFLETFNLRAIAGTLATAHMADEVNKLTGDLEVLEGATKKAALGIRLSWSDQLAQLKNSFMNIFTEFSRVFEEFDERGLFTGLKAFFVDLQLTIRENKDEIRKFTQSFFDGFVSVLNVIKLLAPQIKTFLFIFASKQVLTSMGNAVNHLVQYHKGLTGLTGQVTVATTGLERFNGWVNTVSASATAGVIAYQLLAKAATDLDAAMEKRAKHGGAVSASGYEYKIRALNSFKKHLDEYEQSVWDNFDINDPLKLNAITKRFRYLRDIELPKQFNLPPSFFKMVDSSEKWGKVMNQNQIALNKLRKEAGITFSHGIDDEIRDKLDTRILEKKFKSVGQMMKEIIKPPKEGKIEDEWHGLGIKTADSFLEGFNDFFYRKNPFDLSDKKITPPRFSLDMPAEFGRPLHMDRGFIQGFTDADVQAAQKWFNEVYIPITKATEEFEKKMDDASNALFMERANMWNTLWLPHADAVLDDLKAKDAKMRQAVLSISNFVSNIATSVGNFYDTMSKNAFDADQKRHEEAVSLLERRYQQEMVLAEGDKLKKEKLTREFNSHQDMLRREQEEKRKAEFKRQQHYSAIMAGINTAVAVTSVFAAEPGELYIKLLAGAAMALAGGLEIAAIYSKSYANGGMIKGKGNGTSDSVFIRASVGERVLSVREVEKLGGEAGIQGILDEEKQSGSFTLILNNPIGDATYARKVYSQVFKEKQRRFA